MCTKNVFSIIIRIINIIIIIIVLVYTKPVDSVDGAR